MKINDRILSREERAIFALRELYGRHGYTQYTMSKFEEYEFYIRNKDFLLSDHIITFNDPNGTLMALKPDVTLSIIKNSTDAPDAVQKVYYDENVYRVAKGGDAFREIEQVGLECVGAIDDYHLCEVLALAAESLRSIAPDGVLDISHQGVITALLDDNGVPMETQAALIKCISEKNAHEATALCAAAGISPAVTDALRRIISTHGAPSAVLPALREALAPVTDIAPLEKLERILATFDGTPMARMLQVDFSVTANRRYYNGIVFKGFLPDIPDAVLSGGQYDPLTRRLGRAGGGIGFAVYLDRLSMLNDRDAFDVDTVLLYDDSADLQVLRHVVEELSAGGGSVLACRHKPAKLTYRRLLQLQDGEVTDIG